MSDRMSAFSARHDALRTRADHLRATFQHDSMTELVDQVVADLGDAKRFIESPKVSAGRPLETMRFLDEIERKLGELEAALKADGPDAINKQ